MITLPPKTSMLHIDCFAKIIVKRFPVVALGLVQVAFAASVASLPHTRPLTAPVTPREGTPTEQIAGGLHKYRFNDLAKSIIADPSFKELVDFLTALVVPPARASTSPNQRKPTDVRLVRALVLCVLLLGVRSQKVSALPTVIATMAYAQGLRNRVGRRST